MVLHDPLTPGTDAFLRIYNTDGSESGACGNGTRCVAWAMLDDPVMARPRRRHACCSRRRPASCRSDASTRRRLHGRHGRAAPALGRDPACAIRSRTRASSSCRSARSTRRSCTRPPSSTWATRTRSSSSTTSRPTTLDKIRPAAREPPDLSRARQHLARRRCGRPSTSCCGSGSAAPASPAPAARPPARPLVAAARKRLTGRNARR